MTRHFNENTLNEIVLWKVNRYPEVNQEVLDKINDLRRSYSEEKGKEVLKLLLGKKGFALPMASTVLRFALPQRFQIIDQRVYRLIIPGVKELKIPTNEDQQVDFYFDYLENLKATCNKYGISFEKADRILYEVDKLENKDIKLKY